MFLHELHRAYFIRNDILNIQLKMYYVYYSLRIMFLLANAEV